jgi:hypothetical protein
MMTIIHFYNTSTVHIHVTRTVILQELGSTGYVRIVDRNSQTHKDAYKVQVSKYNKRSTFNI